ncbi:MGMT family protein [Salinispirillum marinum]|uniref:MGMT family protein n=2 Tax=Saccharospirillaceae TaxID=255527 RepID=A0ABV8BDL2_9GAMM
MGRAAKRHTGTTTSHGETTGWQAQLYAIMANLPAQRVVSYGALAQAVGVGPRQIARTLRQLPADSRLPWYRVVRSDGHIADFPGRDEQCKRLQEDGIVVSRYRIAPEWFWAMK